MFHRTRAGEVAVFSAAKHSERRRREDLIEFATLCRDARDYSGCKALQSQRIGPLCYQHLLPMLEKGRPKARGLYLIQFADEMCIPSRGSLSPIYSNAGYQKKTILQKPVVNIVISLLSKEIFYA